MAVKFQQNLWEEDFMRMKNWMKYLSMLMSLVLLMTMAPSATAFAAEDGAGKIVLTSFEKLEKPEKTILNRVPS